MVSTRSIQFTSLILITIILLFGLNNNLDIWVQNHFYSSQTHMWFIVRGEHPWLDFILYDGIKKLLIIFYSLLLVLLFVSYRHQWIKRYRREILILVLSGIFVPTTIVALKTITNVPCPCNWQVYGGEYPSIGIFDPYPVNFHQQNKVACWPAGHASFGFSLLALVFVFRNKKAKMTALAVAMSIAWSMGGYKILKGDHFLSHTIIAMIMGWLIILFIIRLIDRFIPDEEVRLVNNSESTLTR